eukprot:TRINITY_DN45917_c0_g1_i1.p1 TRINITY_DN45917_c0_g1~~TRINITY_DN45917_c0_g1_i1.p1  ORF type:complete len:526 (-),score=89.51 TRINITY_DN45917_c0_g1_i1:151-1728(-)
MGDPGNADAAAKIGISALGHELEQDVLLWLSGHESGHASAACKRFRGVFADPAVWRRFLRQEFPRGSCGLRSTDSLSMYRMLWGIEACRALRLYRLPCRHGLGAREGSPGVFCCRGYVFVYGGWAEGPESDLHVAPLASCGVATEAPALNFRRLAIAGQGPPRTYEMKVTVLEDSAHERSDPALRAPNVLVAVTGGYLLGGYHRESNCYGILELTFPDRTSSAGLLEGDITETAKGEEALGDEKVSPLLPAAKWVHVANMAPRSNHSATYIPARAAGPQYPMGYLLLFGGNMGGSTSRTVDVLDLASWTWELNKRVTGHRPPARNSHSALLLRTSSGASRVLVAGGGTGDATNGYPPRGGCDLSDAFWFDPKAFHWSPAPSSMARGRGHVAVRVANAAVYLGGGKELPFGASALVADGDRPLRRLQLLASGNVSLRSRAFGGGCALPDGTIILFGGWHACLGAFDDFVAGRLGGWTAPLCVPPAPPPAGPSTFRRMLMKLGAVASRSFCRLHQACGRQSSPPSIR